MASTLGFVEYVMEQLAGVGNMRMRKMFGEYCVYVNEKPIILVCDNQVYIKMIPELAELLKDAERGPPYDGASERYILDIDDRELAREAIEILERATPVPKPKKKKQK